MFRLDQTQTISKLLEYILLIFRFSSLPILKDFISIKTFFLSHIVLVGFIYVNTKYGLNRPFRSFIHCQTLGNALTRQLKEPSLILNNTGMIINAKKTIGSGQPILK